MRLPRHQRVDERRRIRRTRAVVLRRDTAERERALPVRVHAAPSAAQLSRDGRGVSADFEVGRKSDRVLGLEARGGHSDAARAGDAESIAGEHAPAVFLERGDGGVLVRNRNPDVETGAAVRVDASSAQRLVQALRDAACTSRATRSARAASPRVVPERDDQALQQVRDPACGQQPPALDTRNRGRVTGEDGESQVRAERLRHGSQVHPARAPRLTKRVARPFCDIEGMIILDARARRDGGRAPPEAPVRARRRSRIRRGSARAASAQHAAAPARSARASAFRGRSAIVDRHREDGKAERGREVDDPG